MNRTITVTGTGNISCRPDQTVISMTVKSLDRDYDKSMQNATALLGHLTDALTEIGFAAKDLKTTDFRVNTEHESVRDHNGNYKTVFVGYACVHSLKLTFDFDISLLSRVLSAVAHCLAEPELSIAFTVKDKNAVSEALLESAAANARQKAECLARASGVTLGALLTIDYHFGDPDLRSRTEYAMDKKCMALANTAMRIEPEDVTLADSATFVWEIK